MAETEELAENDPGELGEVVQMQDESKNGKGLGEAKGAGAKNLDSSKQDESSFGEVDVAETEKLAEHDPGEPGGNTAPLSTTDFGGKRNRRRGKNPNRPAPDNSCQT